MDEIQDGNMLALPRAADARALGSRPGARPASASPAPASRAISGTPSRWWCRPSLISTVLGALNGYVLTKWRFRGHTLVFGLMLFACFIPFQSVLLPMATVLGNFGRFGVASSDHRLHVRLRQPDREPRVRPRGLRPRLHHPVLPQLLRGVPDRAGQAPRRSTAPASSRSSGASCCRIRCRSSWSR